MTKQPVLSDVGNILSATIALNDNWDAIQEAFNNTLSRDGSTPNEMEADFDLNDNDLLNVKNLDLTGILTISGVDITDKFAQASADAASAAQDADDAAASEANAAESAINAALYDPTSRFVTIADMAASTDPQVGQYALVQEGFNGEPETFEATAGGLTADGALVVDGVGVQWVSKRLTYLNDAEFQADPRSDTAFSDGDIAGVGGPSGWSMVKVSSGEHRETDGGAKWKAVPTVIGYVLEQFGVDGSASSDDFAAWEVASSSAITDGVPLVGTPGVTYLFHPANNGRLNIAVGDGQSFILDMRGATLKFSDNIPYSAGLFYHMIYVIMRSLYGVTNATAESVEIRNFIADGNLRGQSDPEIGGTLTEQWSSVKVQVLGSDGNRLKRCVIENFTQIDPIADTILVGPSTSSDYDLDGDGYFESATIGAVYIKNGHAGTRNGARAFIGLGSGCGDVVIDGITCDIPQGVQNNAIETEFSTIGEQFVNVKMSNVYIDDLEFGGKSGSDDQFNVDLENVETRGFFLMFAGNVRASNSKLRISLSNAQRIKRFFASNVTFIHAVYDDGGIQNVRPIAMAAPETSSWKEVNCSHIVEGSLDPGADNPLFDMGTESGTDYGKNVYEFEGTTFDPLAPISISTYGGGLAKTKGCTLGGTLYAVQTGSFSSFAGGWLSSGDDMTKVTGNNFRIISSITGSPGQVRLDGGFWDTFAYTVTGTAWKEALRQSGRARLSSSSASGPGVVGDTIQLDDAAYTSAASASPVMWRCVSSAISSATWLPILNKP